MRPEEEVQPSPSTGAGDGVRIVASSEVPELISQSDCNEAMEIAFNELSMGLARSLPRNRLYLPLEAPDAYYLHSSVVGAVRHYNTLAVRIDSLNFQFLTRPDGLTRMSYPSSYPGLILLFKIDSGRLYGIVHDHTLSAMRVAATSAIVSKRMARSDAKVVGLFGAGQQAMGALMAHAIALPRLERAVVYVTTPDNREQAEIDLSQASGLSVEAVSSPRDAVRGVDIVLSATSSFEPTFDGNWIEPGQHVAAIVNSDYFIRKSELDMNVVRKSDVMIVNSKDYVRAGRQPEVMTAVREGWFEWDDVLEVSDLIGRTLHGRTSATEVTLHFNNGGMGIQFAAVGALVIGRATQEGVGTILPRELFTGGRAADLSL